jgi:hypothetical protein
MFKLNTLENKVKAIAVGASAISLLSSFTPIHEPAHIGGGLLFAWLGRGFLRKITRIKKTEDSAYVDSFGVMSALNTGTVSEILQCTPYWMLQTGGPADALYDVATFLIGGAIYTGINYYFYKQKLKQKS